MNLLLLAVHLSFLVPVQQEQDALKASLAINEGAASTKDRVVTLRFIKAVPESAISEISLSSDGKTWDPWRPFAEVIKFELTGSPGEKTVYARFADGTGVVSEPVQARIVLEPSVEQENAEPSSRPEPFFARFKTGLWIEGPSFKSRTVEGSRKLTSDTMATLNLAFGTALSDSFSLELFGEAALGADATVLSAGVAAGFTVYEGPLILGDGLLEIRVAAFASNLDVHLSGFGDFDLGFGFQAGIGGSWNLAGQLWLDAEAGFRGAWYSWSGPEVLDGDEYAQSLGAELMLGISYRF